MKKIVLSLTVSAALSIGALAGNRICPIGFQVPSNDAFESALNGASNASEAYDKLKLTLSGYRNPSNASLYNEGGGGYYWTSSFSDSDSRPLRLRIDSSGAGGGLGYAAYGFAVRCKKK